jgi:orotidine 5'-phosphate decarboxylase subfamily 2
MARNFRDLLERQFADNKLLCVGLDSKWSKIPERFCTTEVNSQLAFNQHIIEATCDITGAYKPNLGFYLSRGHEGVIALRNTVAHVHNVAPHIPVILDNKSGDVFDSSVEYAEFAFGYVNADAVTLHPTTGMEKSLEPFLEREDKGCFILCRTSNPGAKEFQDCSVRVGCEDHSFEHIPLYQYVAKRVAHHWNRHKNCGVVAGATYPDEVSVIRRLIGDDMWILSPGVGKQGGALEGTLRAGINSRGTGILINSSSGIIFADDPRSVALELHHSINQFRKGAIS